MITRYTFGNPFKTEAVVAEIAASDVRNIPDAVRLSEDCMKLNLALAKDDIVYGLGENVGGINKRGRKYISNCMDDPNQTEGRHSLYAAHNFVLVSGTDICMGLFIDYPSTVTFDVGFTDKDLMTITVDTADYDLYIIEGKNALDIIGEFRKAIGESYVAPKWAFGYIQSRWGYITEDDVRDVVSGYRDNKIPLEGVCLDIDYMERYKDFTINDERFPDFADFVAEMKHNNIHLIPIIDAGVKIEDGYDIYEEGVKNNYFCKDADGNDFVAAVWPGRVHMPDFLNSKAREWFGDHYAFLTEKGIDGFWNDMNEPALFYSDKSLKKVMDKLHEYDGKDIDLQEWWAFQGMVNGLANNPEDYRSFYHNVDGEQVRHDKVHNLYGYNMTRSASEAFKRIAPDKKILMFSRSSSIGMHRYGGIWTGDNASWWSHIELIMHQLPALNMCGFLYCGADTGGFGFDTTEELLMRFIEMSMFTPLMRNHAALGSRLQEVYRFKDVDSFRNLLNLRYSLIPYLYSEYVKAVRNNSLLFTPLGMVYTDDKTARLVEDELLVGESIMITPIYKENARGRYVYLPEDMLMLRFRSPEDYDEEMMSAGHHYVDVDVNEVLIWVRKGHALILGKGAESTADISHDNFNIIKCGDVSSYTYYDEYENESETILNF
ncbi:MAG: glycoside hydrolase family 31 protein [Lachnospiraceae bacterium]|nr:glycoside hydrolase family 31 protein [Lachnospiraceae bacterium]